MVVEGYRGLLSYTWGYLERDQHTLYGGKNERKTFVTYRNVLEAFP